jgi:YD repeat-containing protein
MAPKSAPDARRTQLLYLLIALGIALLAMAFLALRSASADDAHEFVGHKKCKSCHAKEAIGDQYGQWLESKHAKALTSLATEKAKKWASEAGVADPQSDERCVKCHTTAHGVPDEKVAKKFDRTAGVQCEACHGAGKDYRKKKIMVDRDKAIAKGLVPQTEAVCTTCHNDKSPAWDPQRYTLADGRKVGFDYDQAVKAIAHPVPEGYDPMTEGEAD